MANIAQKTHVYLQTIGAVTAIAGDRGHSGHLPKGVTKPAYVYSTTSTTEHDHLTGRHGAAGSDVQIDCYGDTRLEADALEEAIRIAMLATPPITMDSTVVSRVYVTNKFDADEQPRNASDKWVYRTTIEFNLFHDIATP